MNKNIVRATVTGARVETNCYKQHGHANMFVIETTNGDVNAFWFDNHSFRRDWEKGTFNPIKHLSETYGTNVADEIFILNGKHWSNMPTEQNISDGWMYIGGAKIQISELP